MRQYAYLKEPLPWSSSGKIYKIMLFEAEEGTYLFEYNSPDALQSAADRLYDSSEELFADWNDLIDARGWMELDDPLPNCQQDAFLPVRLKGRDTGTPEWGKFEILIDGVWKEYTPK